MQRRKTVSVLLLLCILLSVVSTPASVFAVEDETLSNAFTDAIDETFTRPVDISVSEESEIEIDSKAIIGEDCKIFEYIDSEEFEKTHHISRIPEEEELNTYVFLNNNGTKSVYYLDENVKFIDKNGNIKEKDISLVEKTDGYAIARNEFDLHIPNSASSGISMSYNGYDVKITPQSTVKNVSAKKNDDFVVYESFFGTNTILVYTPMLSGIKEDIIMKTYIPNAVFSFMLDTDGLGLYYDDDGYYLAESETAEAVLNLGKVIIYDAIGKPDYGTMTVTTVADNQKYMLSVSAPEEFLTDPTTVYPVTIDPTLTVSDTTSGDGAVEDTVLFSNRPTKNYGEYKFLSIGYVDSTYGVGRVAVKLPGLYNSVEYQNVNASEITSVKFYCRDSSGNSAQNINLYRITSAAWDENSVTYGDSVTYSTATNWGTSLPNGTSTAFDITTLVKGWKNGSYTASKGFILVNSNETSASCKKAPYSSEYTTTSYRPYVVFTFDPAATVDISDGSNNTVDVNEGSFRQLTATNAYNMGCTWSSSNTTVASVSSTGMVTAHKAGETTITASYIFNGGTYSTTCTVYVYIADGVYYIQNLNSNNYLHVKYGNIADGTNVYQYSKYMDSASNNIKIRQMWKIKHLEQGYYSIRPMNKLDMGLRAAGTNVDIYSIGTTDTIDFVPPYCKWTIDWYSTGYIFKNNGSDSLTMQIENASTSTAANVIASTYSTGVNCRWALVKVSSPPSGAYWFDKNSEAIITGISATKTIVSGSSVTASNLGLVPVVYSPSTNEQSFSWSSDATGVANVNPSIGLISANNAGNAVITATSLYGNHKLLLNIVVKSSDPFHQDNIQYMRYIRITGENWWGLGDETDHTINIVKSTKYSNDYCIIHDNINTGYYREIYIDDGLKNTLDSLEEGYQEHYNIIPAFNTTTNEENAAHSSKEETDQLVEDGYFSSGSSEYYGVWAYNYVSLLNLADYWRGVVDTATSAYGVYLTATSFYYSYLMTTSTTTMQVSSSQYGNTASIIDDIDDAISGMSYSNKTTISAEERNTILAQQGYTDPVPYKPQTPVVQYQQTSSTQYVRVYTSGNKNGKWLMQYKDIQGLTASEIQSKFALPSKPTHYCFVDVPSSTTVYVGVVNESSVTGTLQYELGTTIPNSAFGADKLLP